MKLCYEPEIMRLASILNVVVNKDTPGACFTCRDIDGGAPLSGFAMVGALRLAIGGAVGVLSWGWLDFKDTAARYGLPWSACVVLSHPNQIRACKSVLVGKDAHKRHDWRQWAGVVPRTRDHIGGLVARTASADLTVGQLAKVCGISPTTARRYLLEFNLPYKAIKK